MLTDISLLTASPGPMKRLEATGANYYDGELIISHLTRCLGPAGWSWTTGEHGYDEQADQVWVVGTLTVRITVLDGSGDELVIGTTHTERGWQVVKRRRNDGTLVDLGSDYKAADTDALKRAARLVGVGLDAWAKTSPTSAPRPTPTRPDPKPVAGPPAELSPAARAEASARYVDLLAQATALGFRASWTTSNHATWSDVQLGKYSGLLEQHLARRASA